MQALDSISRGKGERVGKTREKSIWAFFWGGWHLIQSWGSSTPSWWLVICPPYTWMPCLRQRRPSDALNWTEPCGDPYKVCQISLRRVDPGTHTINKAKSWSLLQFLRWEPGLGGLCIWVPPPMLTGPEPVCENQMTWNDCHWAPLGSTLACFQSTKCMATSGSMCRGWKHPGAQ